MEWNAALESFGSSLGIDGLAPDADGSCSLLFDGENEITFTHDEEDRALFMYSEIGDAADLSKNACLALLEASLLGAETGGARSPCTGARPRRALEALRRQRSHPRHSEPCRKRLSGTGCRLEKEAAELCSAPARKRLRRKARLSMP